MRFASYGCDPPTVFDGCVWRFCDICALRCRHWRAFCDVMRFCCSLCDVMKFCCCAAGMFGAHDVAEDAALAGMDGGAAFFPFVFLSFDVKAATGTS